MIEYEDSSGKVVVLIERDEIRAVRNIIGSMGRTEMRKVLCECEADLLCQMYHEADYILSK